MDNPSIASNAGERPDSFFASQIRTNFRVLVRMIGFDLARATVAEIINSEAERKARVADRA